MRRPPLTLAVPSGDRQPPGMSRSDTLRSGAAIWSDLRNATQAAPALSAGTAALARRGIAIWEQVPRSALVRHDVASLSARCRAAGTPIVRNAVRSQRAEIVDFRASQVAAWSFERRLAVGSRLARLGATTCALQRRRGRTWHRRHGAWAAAQKCGAGCRRAGYVGSRLGVEAGLVNPNPLVARPQKLARRAAKSNRPFSVA